MVHAGPFGHLWLSADRGPTYVALAARIDRRLVKQAGLGKRIARKRYRCRF